MKNEACQKLVLFFKKLVRLASGTFESKAVCDAPAWGEQARRDGLHAGGEKAEGDLTALDPESILERWRGKRFKDGCTVDLRLSTVFL